MIDFQVPEHILLALRLNKDRHIGSKHIPSQKGVCRWCLGSLPKRRTVWCGQSCVNKLLKLLDILGFVFARDNGKCQSCFIAVKKYTDHAGEVDHILPLCEGGWTGPDNLRLLCQRCHKRVTAELSARRAAKRIQCSENPKTRNPSRMIKSKQKP